MIASMMAVLPVPTGPPMPIRLAVFMASPAQLEPSVHEHADVRVHVRGREESSIGAKHRHVLQVGAADLAVVVGDAAR